MLSAILAILGSSTVGSLLGGIFAWLNRKADIEAKRLELAHEVDKWAHELQVKDKDLEYARQEIAGKTEVAVIEGDSQVEAARMAAIAASHAADKITAEELAAAGKWAPFLILAAAVNKAVRPLLTAALAGTAIWMNVVLTQMLMEAWPDFTPNQKLDAGMQAFAWITGQASAVIGYWFVSRGSSTEGKTKAK